MGEKEERAPVRTLRGYAGAIRPQMTEAGACIVCALPVFIDAPPDDRTTYRRTDVVHLSCDPKLGR